MFSSQDIRVMQRQAEWFERHRVAVSEELFAELEKVGFGADTADLMQECAAGFDSHTQVVHVLLHPLHLRDFPSFGRAHGLIKRADITQNVVPAWHKQMLAGERLTYLME